MKHPRSSRFRGAFVVLAAIVCLFIDVSGSAVTIDLGIDATTATGLVRPLLGVNAGPLPSGELGNPAVSAQYTDIGVNAVRTHDFTGPVDMYVMYPDTSADPSLESSYDFTESDTVMAAIHGNGHKIYFRLGNSYDRGTTPPANIPNWIEAAKNVIRHYTQGKWGGFYYPIHYVEIWNEPQNTHFWTGTGTEFLQFFEEVAKALKAEFPELKIGGPGFLPTGYAIGTFPPTFLTYCRNQSVPLDFLSWHIYNNDPAVYRGAGLFYRELLDSYGYTTASSHITEWNTEPGPERYNAQGAAQMTAAWVALQDARVDVSTFYRGTDTSMDAPDFYGLFYADGSYKKMAYAFKAWSRMVDHPLRITGVGGTTGTAVMAALSSNRRSLAILLSHYTVDGFPDTVDAFRLHVTGFAGAGDRMFMERHVVSATRDLSLVERGAVDAASPILRAFPINTVHLIRLSESPLSAKESWDLY
jgi:hypothetical protein